MTLLLDFESRLESVLLEALSTDYFAAVGVVQCKDKWLLGLARKTNDDRENHWCFPGGGIKRGEDTSHAAVREVREETGIRCRAVGKPFSLPNKKGVAFVHCKAASGQKFDNNHEFSAIGWFSRREMKALKLYHNVTKLIDRVNR